MIRIFFALILVVLASCQQDMRLCAPTFQTTPSSVQQKPILALVPILDRSTHRLPWNVAQSLTTDVLRYLSIKDRLYMVDQEKMVQLFKELQNNTDPIDPQWVKKHFKTEEFVAFVELSKCKETLLAFHKELPDASCPEELYLSAKVRIFDLRGSAPRLVLSELVNHSENIPKEFNRINRSSKAFEQENFRATPHGVAYDHFAKEIAERIEDYVLLAQAP